MAGGEIVSVESFNAQSYELPIADCVFGVVVC